MDGNNTQILADQAIEQQILADQRTTLDELTGNLENMDRAAIKALAQDIANRQFSKELVAEYIHKLNHQYDIIEDKELRELCADIENRDIDSLVALKNCIKDGQYQVKFTTKYYGMIDARINYLHVVNMEAYCINLATAPRQELNVIRFNIDQEQCSGELKVKFYSLIAERTEQLDYQELNDITANYEEKSLVELEELFAQLNSGNYSSKFIRPFVVKVRLKLEQAQCTQLDEMLVNIEGLSKDEVIAVKDNVNRLGYPEYVVHNYLAKIDDMICRMELQELMQLANNFNEMSLRDVQDLRARVNQKNLMDRTKGIYLNKLFKRERVIGLQSIRPYACMAKQISNQFAIGDRVSVATLSDDYDSNLVRFVQNNNVVDYNNIPAFFIPEVAFMAVNKTHIYFMHNSAYIHMRFDEIRSITCEKKFLSDSIIITSKLNQMITIPGRAKITQSVVSALQTYMENINNTSVLSSYPGYQEEIPSFTSDNLGASDIATTVDEDTVIDILLTGFKKQGSVPNMKSMLDSNWTEVQNKVKNGFGISNDGRIIMYQDSTLFNSAREGSALGTEAVYIKDSKQGLYTIPLDSIYSISYEVPKLVINTVNNETYEANISNINEENARRIATLWSEYVKGIQLVRSLKTTIKSKTSNTEVNNIQEGVMRSTPEPAVQEQSSTLEPAVQEESSTLESSVQEEIQAFEPVVQQVTKEEYVFCIKCGKKMLKGAKFCSQCGNKMI